MYRHQRVQQMFTKKVEGRVHNVKHSLLYTCIHHATEAVTENKKLNMGFCYSFYVVMDIPKPIK